MELELYKKSIRDDIASPYTKTTNHKEIKTKTKIYYQQTSVHY